MTLPAGHDALRRSPTNMPPAASPSRAHPEGPRTTGSSSWDRGSRARGTSPAYGRRHCGPAPAARSAPDRPEAIGIRPETRYHHSVHLRRDRGDDSDARRNACSGTSSPTPQIDASKIEAAISPRPVAILPVALYGQPEEMDESNAIAASHGIAVIERPSRALARLQGQELQPLDDRGTVLPSSRSAATATRRDVHERRPDRRRPAEIRVHDSPALPDTPASASAGAWTRSVRGGAREARAFEWEIEKRRQIGAR